MTRIKLPEGIPYDNTERARAGEGGFSAPDTATPVFARSAPEGGGGGDLGAEPTPDRGLFRTGVYVEKESDSGDEEESDPIRLIHPPHLPAPVLILIAIALVLAAIGAYVVSRDAGGETLCADQPEWNQYNCRKN